jgi:hypothetical protein
MPFPELTLKSIFSQWHKLILASHLITLSLFNFMQLHPIVYQIIPICHFRILQTQKQEFPHATQSYYFNFDLNCSEKNHFFLVCYICLKFFCLIYYPHFLNTYIMHRIRVLFFLPELLTLCEILTSIVFFIFQAFTPKMPSLVFYIVWHWFKIRWIFTSFVLSNFIC